MKKLTNKIREKKEQIELSIITLLMTINFTIPVFAAPSIGQNASNWFLEQVFWIVIIFVFLAALRAYQRGNTVQMITVVIIGGVLLFLIKNPTMLETLGNWAAEILGVR